jgi:hypothetical protein
VADGAGVAAVPLETVGLFFAAPHQGVFDAAQAALDLEAHHAFGVFAGAVYVVEALDFWGTSAYELGVWRAFEAAFGEAAGVAGFFDQLVEGGPFVEDGQGDGDAAKGARGLAAEEVGHAVTELLEF